MLKNTKEELREKEIIFSLVSLLKKELKPEKVFLDMLKDRNETTHIYDKETEDKIFNRIKSDYIPAIENVVKKLVIE
jgi:hypothetical protein